jgi:hypothetical protein
MDAAAELSPRIRLPNDTERQAIFGMTGTGKTVFGLHQLQMRSYDRMPWVIVDYKLDPTIAQIPHAEEIRVTDNPPRFRGLYVVRPLPHQRDEIEGFMWKVWKRGRTGLFFDEAYMIHRYSKAYQALLTQGRAKRIPVITLSQQPAWISPFVQSESDFLVSFFLFRPADVQRVRDFMPGVRANEIERFHSWWFDVKANRKVYLSPCPDENEILNRFDQKPGRKRFL